MKLFIEKFNKQTPITLALVASIINYFFIVLFCAAIYDTSKELAGAPASMFIFFGGGPVVALFLSLLTLLLIWYMNRRKIRFISGIIVMFHLLIFSLLSLGTSIGLLMYGHLLG
ncbi:hypothetical protein SAMN05428962_2545 [Paenibacillus sp. BC26]|nr:hypothetical protein SAMN05428962_2545 [Paenibacillus sp. BC26]